MKKTKNVLTSILITFILLFAAIGDLPCLFKFSFGIPCPLCGFTRAIRLAFYFDFSKAFWFHPLWPILLIAAAIIIISLSPLSKIKYFRFLKQFHNNYFFIIPLAVTIGGVWIIRMLMFFPTYSPMDIKSDALIFLLFNLL